MLIKVKYSVEEYTIGAVLFAIFSQMGESFKWVCELIWYT